MEHLIEPPIQAMNASFCLTKPTQKHIAPSALWILFAALNGWFPES